MSKGQLFIFSGPSGIGKDTVLKELLKLNDKIKLSISSVTRNCRPGEIDGEKYDFISREKFERMIQNDELLEHNVYVGNYYGTPRKPVEQWLQCGFDVILEVDVNGACNIKQKMPDAVSVFLMPPSISVLYNRLTCRGTENKSTIDLRMKVAFNEIALAVNYDYIVVNDDLKNAVADLNSIVRANALTTTNMTKLIDEVKKDAESFTW